MQEKERFIESYKSYEGTFKVFCQSFGISAKTGYKFIKRYKEQGLAGLKEQSRAPKSCPGKTPVEVEELIVNTRSLHPTWSGEKLKRYLEKRGHEALPTEKTIDRILKRYGLITQEESEKHTPWQRFEHENPNDLWQMDFKGHFATKQQRCHPLTLLDDHSRFSLLIKACEDERTTTVKTGLIDVFRKYGLPKRMTMDNGAPWGYSGEQNYTVLSAWLIHVGIRVSHSRPKHPQTQGKLERFHRTLKLELLNRYSFNDLQEAQEGFIVWQKMYNEERPHQAINYEVPAERYRESERVYPEKLPAVEYGHDMIVRKVQQRGVIHFQGKEYRVGDAFRGHAVGLKQNEKDGLVDVYFCHQRVVKIDLRQPIIF